jgi:membrane bound O-acyltransferase family protein
MGGLGLAFRIEQMKTISLAGTRLSWKAERRGPGRSFIAWLPLVALPLATIAFRSVLIPWVFMWLLALAIFVGCKWQTWWQQPARHRASWQRSAAYLFLWPGMDAEEFLATDTPPPHVECREWLVPLFRTLAGALLVWSAARFISAQHPLCAGWMGMLGIVLVLHFGIFDSISAAWRSAGIHAQPIMRQPLKSESLGEFWGKRWNLGFRKLSHTLVFRPLQRRFGAVAATVGAFLASGLIHDLVISLPARAGYGLPTAYFLLQGCGVIAERSRTGKKLGLGQGTRGWLWMAFVTTAPLFILFHPCFVLRVIVPFLHAVVR